MPGPCRHYHGADPAPRALGPVPTSALPHQQVTALLSRWIRRLLVVTGARCPLTKPVGAAVELQGATVPHCLPIAAEACSPAVFAHTWCIAS
jgi:hypothetical protein